MLQIFRTIRRLLAFLGLNLNHSTEAYQLLNARLFLGSLVVSIATILYILYLFYVANTLIEYMQCIGILASVIENGICFTAIVFQSDYLFECVIQVEKTINASKFKKKKTILIISNS